MWSIVEVKSVKEEQNEKWWRRRVIPLWEMVFILSYYGNYIERIEVEVRPFMGPSSVSALYTVGFLSFLTSICCLIDLFLMFLVFSLNSFPSLNYINGFLLIFLKLKINSTILKLNTFWKQIIHFKIDINLN